MVILRAENYEQIPGKYKQEADFIFEKVGKGVSGRPLAFPGRDHDILRQKPDVFEENVIGLEGDQEYSGNLHSRVVGGTILFKAVVSEEEVEIEEGAEMIEIGESDDYLIVTADDAELSDLALTIMGSLTAPGDLEAEYDEENKVLTVFLATEQTLSADASDGDGQVDITVEEDGATDVNDLWKLAVAPAVGEGDPLSVTVDDTNNRLVVNLATLSEEIQAETTITSLNDGGTASVIEVNATEAGDFDGTAGNGIVVEFIDSGEGGISASYDDGVITFDFGDVANPSATEVVGEIDAITGFDASVDTEGDGFTVADDAGELTATLEGGRDAGDPDDSENTPSAIATAIGLEDEFSASTSASDPWVNEIDDEEFEVDLDDAENGLDDLDPEISGLSEFNTSTVGTLSNVTLDADDFVDNKFFIAELLRDGSFAGSVDCDTGEFEVDFGGSTESDLVFSYE